MNENRNACYILMIINTVIYSILIIPLAWLIPMTLAYKRSREDQEPHTALAICSILFTGILGIIAGIIMLTTYKTDSN